MRARIVSNCLIVSVLLEQMNGSLTCTTLSISADTQSTGPDLSGLKDGVSKVSSKVSSIN